MEIRELIKAETQNLELVKLGQKTSKPGELVEFEQALTSPKIHSVSDESIVEVLRLVMMKLGLRAASLPSKIETAVLMEHIRRTYKGLTISELRLAFEMAISGKLDVDPGCYENFSCLYVSKIMNAYRDWAAEEYQHVKKEIPAIEKLEDLSDKTMIDWIKDTKEKIIHSDWTWEWMPVSLYDFLAKKGRMKITVERKDEYLNRALLIRDAQLLNGPADELAAFRLMKDAGIIEGKDEVQRMRNICKKMLVFDWINSHDIEHDLT